jgi:hypothetical protein
MGFFDALGVLVLYMGIFTAIMTAGLLAITLFFWVLYRLDGGKQSFAKYIKNI